jgi:hypothetical protein
MIPVGRIVAYTDGEADEDERAALEAAMRSDPALAAEVERHRQLREKLSRAFAPVLDADPPQRLVETLRPSAPVIDLAAKRRGQSGLVVRLGAMAASFLAGIIVTAGVLRQDADVRLKGEGAVAQGMLERALTTQLASENVSTSSISLAFTFRDRDGRYCRTFRARTVEGLACRQGEQWLLEYASAVPARTDYEMAASAEIMALVERRIEGELLDAESERRARDAGW